jgi:hypothetical protein
VIPQLRAVPTKGPGGQLQFELSEIEDLAAIGLSQEQIAVSMACSRSTIALRLATDEQFRQAYEKGRSRMRSAIATGLFHHAVVQRNITAQIYLSKVHLQWRDVDSPNAPREVDVHEVASAIRDQLNALNQDEGAPE